ncbi:hypothetical protein [Pedobacter cryoconitis]|uniref:Uncharacterized protein n=1 Tax=Pedobacter cryoconitis TaxID=188932 RepID=A0A7X0MKI1_9SPHI|nr:hypothetical protein [Pedobacter cryoconitis]MBB6502577.1 hypothetical protein [Pedobacter cryoconitis]
MKTSTMLIIAAILVILGCLTVYNYKIKEVYLTREYRSPFRGMEFTPLNGIEKLNLKIGDNINVEVKYGEKEGIWIDKDIKEKISLKITGQTLNLGLVPKKEGDEPIGYGNIILFTRKLNAVSSFSYDVPKAPNRYDHLDQMAISGYKTDHLNLNIGFNTSISLRNMELRKLDANVGDKRYGDAELILSSDTRIDTALLNVPGKSKLSLFDPKIVKTSYNLSDSASVFLNGKVAKMLR